MKRSSILHALARSPAHAPAFEPEQRAFDPTTSHQHLGNLALCGMLVATTAVYSLNPPQRTIDCAAYPGGSAVVQVDTRQQQRFWLGDATSQHFGRTAWRDKVVVVTLPPDGIRVGSEDAGFRYSYPELTQTGEPWVVMNNRVTDAYVWADPPNAMQHPTQTNGMIKVSYTCGDLY